MEKTFILLGLWIFLTSVMLFGVSVVGYAALTNQTVSQLLSVRIGSVDRNSTRWGRTDETPKEMVAESESADARVPLVQNFLERHTSPILKEDPEFAQFLVNLADANAMDFRLLPAIAMQESNLCKVVPQDSHNCLGLGVHKRGTWGFETYRDNFTAAAKILKENYIDKGLTTTELIETKYNPTSANRDGSWAASVNQWMAEMRYDDRQLGRELKSDADLLEFTEP